MHFEKKIGIIGGGQLGKMICQPASLLGFKTHVYSNKEDAPACTFASDITIGEFEDKAKILEFAAKCDFLTIEFESVNVEILTQIEAKFPEKLSPKSDAVFTSQNRLREKEFFNKSGVKTAEFANIKTAKEAENFLQKHGKFILKTTENGYDGKGQFVISAKEDITTKIPFVKEELIAEKFIPFAFEASVILTRFQSGKIVLFPIPTNIHKGGILHKSIVHAQPAPWKAKMEEMAVKIAGSLKFIGTMAVEFFVLENGEILANEMAPRPHNSGHFSLNLCNICQFESHVRAITNLPHIKPKLLFEGEMLNLIGEEVNLALNFLDKPNARLHIYGKQQAKGRKMGHINFIYDEIFS